MVDRCSKTTLILCRPLCLLNGDINLNDLATFVQGSCLCGSCLDVQGCALAESGGPWHLTFALGQLENLRFFIQIIYWDPRFYSFRALGSVQFSLEHSLDVANILFFVSIVFGQRQTWPVYFKYWLLITFWDFCFLLSVECLCWWIGVWVNFHLGNRLIFFLGVKRKAVSHILMPSMPTNSMASGML